MSDEIDRDELHCPNCDDRLDKPINDIWKDPNVKEALRYGRTADDIMVLDCPKCGRWNYWNEGSGYWCRFCERGWCVLSEDEEPGDTEPIIYANEAITLADTVTVTTDGYDNETLANT